MNIFSTSVLVLDALFLLLMFWCWPARNAINLTMKGAYLVLSIASVSVVAIAGIHSA